MKRILLLLLILFVSCIAIAYFYFNQLNAQRVASNQALNQITSQSGLVFSLEYNKNSLDILTDQDLLQKTLDENQLDFLNAILDLSKNSALNNAIEGQQVYIGFIPITPKKNQLLITIQPSEEIPTTFFNQNKIKALSPDYFEVKNDSITFYIYKNKNFISASADLEILKKLNHHIPEENKFTQFIKKHSAYQKAQLAHLFINFDSINPYLKNQLKEFAQIEVEFFLQKGNYAKLDYNFSKNQILLSGLNEFTTENSYIKLFENQSPKKAEIINILPENTISYQLFTYSNFESFYQELTRWQSSNPQNQKQLIDFATIESKYGLKLKTSLSPYFKDQFILFQLKNGEKLAAIQLNNGEKVSQLLLDLSSNYSPEISVIKEKNLFNTLFGPPLLRFEKPFYTIIDNYLVLGNYPSSIQVFLNQYKTDKTLANLPDFQFYQSQIMESNISLYWQPKNTFKSFSIHLSGDKQKFSSSYLAIPNN